MYMQMVDRLAAILPGIDHGAKPIGQSFAVGDASGCYVKIPQQLLGVVARLGERTNMFARDNQNMCGRLRIDIPERIGKFVGENFLRRSFTGNNLAE
jgi:hypothetical protein